jgi:hypothetical protein
MNVADQEAFEAWLRTWSWMLTEDLGEEDLQRLSGAFEAGMIWSDEVHRTRFEELLGLSEIPRSRRS